MKFYLLDSCMCLHSSVNLSSIYYRSQFDHGHGKTWNWKKIIYIPVAGPGKSRNFDKRLSKFQE